MRVGASFGGGERARPRVPDLIAPQHQPQRSPGPRCLSRVERMRSALRRALRTCPPLIGDQIKIMAPSRAGMERLGPGAGTLAAHGLATLASNGQGRAAGGKGPAQLITPDINQAARGNAAHGAARQHNGNGAAGPNARCGTSKKGALTSRAACPNQLQHPRRSETQSNRRSKQRQRSCRLRAPVRCGSALSKIEQ